MKSVFDWYTPARWGYCLTYQQTMLDDPCIYLADLDGLYGREGNDSAQSILKDQFLALYEMSMAKEKFEPKTAEVAAGMFFGMWGKKCTLNHMMLYFARYPMAFKTTLALFDTMDILKQYGESFMPWMQSHGDTQQQDTKPDGELRGIPALHKYLRDTYASKGRDMRESNLYKYGMITEEEIQKLEQAR